MRYRDLSEVRRHRPRTTAPSLIGSTVGAEVMHGAPGTKAIKLIIRLIPAVYRELDLRVGHGGPDAMIDINDAWVRFPEPFDENGDISEHCRKWIVEMVRDASIEIGLSMCILFATGPIYVWDGDLVIGGRAPEGGLWL